MQIPTIIKQIINVLLGSGFLATAIMFIINIVRLILNWKEKNKRKVIFGKLVKYFIIIIAIFFSVLLLNFTPVEVLEVPDSSLTLP
jgi:uncharacterized membrane protein